ncbi:calcineurin-like phosphoesterase C-terminal domain-containing protein [Hyphomonas sp.]|uniref:calcineurin-like phosphoesterase C-terminal domain-containing protein n=1 Tax=Hyphomonas sp. TaxID=87 RepID=UPI001BCBBC55|nr:calcineurin-like phosphoesterase C-terminal domain-containing protein [Hyphomonas sp.]
MKTRSLTSASLLVSALFVSACATQVPAPDRPDTLAAAPVEPAISARPAAALEAYFAGIDVVPGTDDTRETVSGRVFHDQSRDGRYQDGEAGIRDVLVSNGLDVVRTDADGRYTLPARADMSVTVIQPSGWRTPTDENWVPQFAYEHKPAGTPKALRFGGLPPTGPLPEAIHFPLMPAERSGPASCLVIGDSQTYSNNELGYFRDSVVKDVVSQDVAPDCAIFVGDVVGDDLDLLGRLQAIGGAMRTPQYYVHGNHDFDFDADHDDDSSDSWRRLYGPAYYAFEIADTLFVSLDNVVYPCGREDAALPERDFCLSDERKAYNGRVRETQMTWLSNLIAETPADRRIVFLHHIPFVSFVDNTSRQHQTDNVTEIHALAEGRAAVSFSGHTHTLEVLQQGDLLEGWTEAVGTGPLPFPHIIAGAASGGWWNGDFDMDGVPMSLSRTGEPRGYLQFGFGAEDISLDFVPLGTSREREMAVSLNTPGFRAWYEAIMAWRAEPAATRDPVPPVSINDLADIKLVTPEDLSGGTLLTTNLWLGSTATQVTLSLNGGPAMPMERTQTMRGDAPLIGATFADPYAVSRQLSVSRVALQSRSGNEAAQGLVSGRRATAGPLPPQPSGSVADRSPRLWRYLLPADLAPGVYTATIEAAEAGNVARDRFVFEVVTERPQPDWRADVWNTFDNGLPVR